MVRRVLTILAALCLVLGVASATSLGTFTDVAFSALETSRVQCTADEVTLLDGTVDLVTGTITGTSQIETVRLTNLTGDCVGMRPIVVVGGFDLLDLASGEQVLFVIDTLPELTTTGTVEFDLADPIDLGDGSVALYDLTVATAAHHPR